MVFLSKETISVSIGILFGGAVSMTLMSLIPIKEKCNVLGIGVAVRVNAVSYTHLTLPTIYSV